MKACQARCEASSIAHLLDGVQAHVICDARLVVEHDGLAQRKERHHEHLQVSLLEEERR